MSAIAIWEEVPLLEAELPVPERRLLTAAREAFLTDPHYIIDMMHAANRVRSKRRQQRKRSEVALAGI